MEIKIKDKVYKLRHDRKLSDELVKWAKQRLPCPIEAIRGKLTGFSKEHQDLMMREAMREARRPRNGNDPEIIDVLMSEEGILHFLKAVYGPHNPDLSMEEIWELNDAAAEEHGIDYLANLLQKGTVG